MKAGSITRTLTILAAILAVGACSGTHHAVNRDGATGDGSDTENAVDASGSGGGDVGDRGSPAMETALLRVDDLPDGMIDLRVQSPTVETCGMRTEVPDDGGDPFPTAVAAFAREHHPVMPDIFEKIIVAPAGGGAQVMQQARWLLGTNCTSGGESDGLEYLSATDLTVPALGDESLAKRVTIKELANGKTFGVDVLYARAGDTIIALVIVDPDNQTNRLTELGTIALDRASAKK